MIYSTAVMTAWPLTRKLGACAGERLKLLVGHWHRASSASAVKALAVASLTRAGCAMAVACCQRRSWLRCVCLRFGGCYNELRGFVKAKACCWVEAGVSASFSRADDDVLPTGRNFYSKDVANMPSPSAYYVGKVVARKLIRRFYVRSGRWLASAALSAWATANMRTGGDDVAIAMAMAGAEPI